MREGYAKACPDAPSRGLQTSTCSETDLYVHVIDSAYFCSENSICQARKVCSYKYRRVLGALPSKGVELLNAAERTFLAGPAEGRWMSADTVAAAVALAPALATRVSPPLHVDYTNVTGLAPNARIVQDADVAGFQQMLLDNLA
ncbi:Uncharacterized protein GBIM_06630 [Gryllus bimaculatus]|nr:Uncharacterized protein GBIM_06630 [Gryllus bimaculatus]